MRGREAGSTMEPHHVDAYFRNLGSKDMVSGAEHLADDIVLISPIFTQPFVGKPAVVPILAGLVGVIDDITPNLKIEAGQDVGVFFTITCQGIQVDGNEHLHLNADGLIDRIHVAWRPLESVVLVQEKLASRLGGTPLRLVPLA